MSAAARAAMSAAIGAEINADDMCDYILDLADGDLADVGAQLKRAADALTKVQKTIKGRIVKAADGATSLRGVEFKAKITYKVVWRLDTKRVKKDMGDQWYDERSKPADQVRIEYGI